MQHKLICIFHKYVDDKSILFPVSSGLGWEGEEGGAPVQQFLGAIYSFLPKVLKCMSIALAITFNH